MAKAVLASHPFLVLDGAFATCLESHQGVPLHQQLWSAAAIHTHPDAIKQVHLAYLSTWSVKISSSASQRSQPLRIALLLTFVTNNSLYQMERLYCIIFSLMLSWGFFFFFLSNVLFLGWCSRWTIKWDIRCRSRHRLYCNISGKLRRVQGRARV
jgi:hypothetical protein